jgi:phage FluMu protein Com
LRSTGSTEAERNESAGAHPDGGDCRCLCGSLLARVVGDRVELKCRRCKRTVSIPLATGSRPVRVDPSLALRRKANAP